MWAASRLTLAFEGASPEKAAAQEAGVATDTSPPAMTTEAIDTAAASKAQSLKDARAAGAARAAAIRAARAAAAATRSLADLNVESEDERPVAGQAKTQRHHRLLALSFLLAVLLPILVTSLYLWGKAVDQYASTVGFSVRREDASSALELLGGLGGLTKSSSSDTDILYEFLRSQKLVADMDARLDLRKIWSKPKGDPIFSFDSSGSIEDLVDYWQRMVKTTYDSGSNLIEVRVLAFDPQDATNIAQALFDDSSQMINALSAIAREDALRYARDDLGASESRLRETRQALTDFRVKHQIVDPTSDILAQTGLVASLQNQLASAQIEMDMLSDANPSDPRLVQITRRIGVIEARIASERSKVGISDTAGSGSDYAALVDEYQRLSGDREFAERSYVASLAAFDAAKAEGERKSRYLAAHILPTTAEVARFPERLSILGVVALFLLLAWSIATLIVYSLKDRR